MVRTEVLNPRLQTNRFDREKAITIIITLLLVLFVYLVLNIFNIPKHRRNKVNVPNIDILIEKYRPVRKIEIQKIDTPQPLTPPLTRTEPKPEKSIPEKPDNTSKYLKQIQKFMKNEVVAPNTQPKKVPVAIKTDPTVHLSTVDNQFLPPLPSSSNMINTDHSSLLRRFPNENRPTQELKHVQSAQNRDSDPKQVDYLHNRVKEPSITAEKKKAANRKIPKISLIELPDNIEEEIPKIFVNIAQWMKDNPHPLPNAIKKLMGYRPPNLTSRVEFQINNRLFEIYLLCVESTYEIKICLIEGTRTTLLIDEGFTHQSHYLRTGTLARTSGGKILSVGSKQKAASRNETQEFYQIFLSWWRSTGMDKV